MAKLTHLRTYSIINGGIVCAVARAYEQHIHTNYILRVSCDIEGANTNTTIISILEFVQVLSLPQQHCCLQVRRCICASLLLDTVPCGSLALCASKYILWLCVRRNIYILYFGWCGVVCVVKGYQPFQNRHPIRA